MPYKDKQVQGEYQRKWAAKRRAVVFEGKVCTACGHDGSEHRLELHHRDPKAKESHRIWTWSWARIWDEVAKCDILCSACHALVHHPPRSVGP